MDRKQYEEDLRRRQQQHLEQVWFRQRRAAGYPVLVASDDQGVAGFASFGDFDLAIHLRVE